MNALRTLAGTHIVTVPAASAAAVLNLCRNDLIPYDTLSADAETVVLRLTHRSTVRLAPQLEALGCTVSPIGGLPALLLRAVHRPGVCVGLLLGLCLLWLSGQVVWDVRIEGAETLSVREVRNDLAACGLSVGTSLRGFRADVVENRVLMRDGRIAWISVNRRGTVAHVQLRETQPKPADGDDSPANLVAAQGGVIERVELLHGNLLVSAGQTVAPGQLLVSGLYDSERVGYRLTRAAGHIYARTLHEMRIEIPLSCTDTGTAPPADIDVKGTVKETSLIFFGKSIKFSKNYRNIPTSCDIIESEEVCSPIRSVGFPISVRTVWYVPRTQPEENIPVTRTPAEAEALAYLELHRRIRAIPGVELLSESIRPALTDTAFVLEVTVTCVEDIAETVPFSAETLPPSSPHTAQSR